MALSTLSFTETYTKAQDILVLVGANPSTDVLAAALGFGQAVQASGKSVLVACPSSLKKSHAALKASERVQSDIGNQNLVISLAVDSKDSIDKVSYNLDEDGKTFNLIVQPRKGHKALSSSNVTYSYAGLQADMMFVFGARAMADLGTFYAKEQKTIDQSETVSVGLQAQSYAKHDVSDPTVASVSELTNVLLQALAVKIDAQAATDLLLGIDDVTQGLSGTSVQASTFETVAQLLRAGGVRQAVSSGQQAPAVSASQDGVQPTSKPVQAPVVDTKQQQKPAADPVVPAVENTASGVPDEWLSPKIYKSSDASNTAA